MQHLSGTDNEDIKALNLLYINGDKFKTKQLLLNHT